MGLFRWAKIGVTVWCDSLGENMSESMDTLVQRADEVSRRASGLGFDWARPEDVLAKMREELDEVAEALERGDLAEVEAESGDLFFALLNFHRLLGITSLQAFAKGVNKFERRFAGLAQVVAAQSRGIEELSTQELDEIWEEIKAREAYGH